MLFHRQRCLLHWALWKHVCLCWCWTDEKVHGTRGTAQDDGSWNLGESAIRAEGEHGLCFFIEIRSCIFIAVSALTQFVGGQNGVRSVKICSWFCFCLIDSRCPVWSSCSKEGRLQKNVVYVSCSDWLSFVCVVQMSHELKRSCWRYADKYFGMSTVFVSRHNSSKLSRWCAKLITVRKFAF